MFWGKLLSPSCTTKTEAASSSKKLAPMYETTWPQISEACNLHTHCCEYLKPHAQGLLHGMEATVGHQPSTSGAQVRFPLKLHGYCGEQSGTRPFPQSSSVSRANSRSTNYSMFTNNTTTRRYIASKLTASLNSHLHGMVHIHTTARSTHTRLVPRGTK